MLVSFVLLEGWMLVALGLWEWDWDLPWQLGSGVRTTPPGREWYPSKETVLLGFLGWKLKQYAGK